MNRGSSGMDRMWKRGRCRWIFLLGIALAGTLGAVHLPTRAQAFRSTNDGVFTDDQAQRGQRVQQRVCAECHISDYYTGGLLDSWAGNTMGALTSLIVNTMPENRPSSLKPEQYADLMAYILKINGFPSGESELPSDDAALSKIIIERKKK